MNSQRNAERNGGHFFCGNKKKTKTNRDKWTKPNRKNHSDTTAPKTNNPTLATKPNAFQSFFCFSLSYSWLFQCVGKGFFRGFYRVGQGFSGFDCVSTGFYLVSSSWKGSVWVCLGSYGFAWVLLGFTEFYCFFSGFYWVLPSFNGFHRVLPNFIGFYWVLLGFTVSYCFFPDFTGFYLVLMGFTVLLGFT